MLVLPAFWAFPAAAQDGLPELRSTHDGVYTEEQAQEGAEVFQNRCATCHSESNPLHGSSFLRVWSGQPLWRLYEYVSLSMPYDAAASLSSEQYSAVVAYLLQMNGYPPGSTPLPTDRLEIAFINFDPHQ